MQTIYQWNNANNCTEWKNCSALQRELACERARTHTHTQTYTHTHTRALARARARTHAYIHARTHAPTCAHTNTHARARMRTHTFIHVHIHVDARTHTHTYTREHSALCFTHQPRKTSLAKTCYIQLTENIHLVRMIYTCVNSVGFRLFISVYSFGLYNCYLFRLNCLCNFCLCRMSFCGQGVAVETGQSMMIAGKC